MLLTLIIALIALKLLKPKKIYMKNHIYHPKTSEMLTRHHIVNRIRGGKTRPDNILMLWEHKHHCWHQVFGNHSIREVINYWERFRFYRERPHWKVIFHDLKPDQAKKLLQRVMRIKRKLRKYR